MFPSNRTRQKPDGTLLVSTNVKVLLSFLVGLVLAIVAVVLVWQQYLASLSQRAQTIATTLEPTTVQRLLEPDSPERSEAVASIRAQLQRAGGVNHDVRSLYLISLTTDNTVRVLADSATSRHKTELDSARVELKAAFADSGVFVEEPLLNHPGNSQVSVYAPALNGTPHQTVLLGMDIPSSTYLTILGLAGSVPLLGSLLVGAVLAMTDNMRRRRQESMRMKSELVSVASHELRTPLTGIRWGEESLLETKLPKKGRETLQSMYDSTLRLQESIEDILQIANWQAGRTNTLTRTSVDILAMLDGILVTQKLPAAQNNVQLALDKDWPKKLLINCDAQRMKRVFNNLISNAIKYSRPNTMVTLKYEKVDGNHLISITDHGIGIPAAEQQKVFQGFYRASNALNHEVTGTGMGLYMSRQAVEQHGGKLWLSSKENQGTTTYIQLP